MDAGIDMVELPFKPWWTGCWESIRPANEYLERCGYKEIEKIKSQQDHIRNKNRTCFAEWHKKQEQKQEQKQSENDANNKYSKYNAYLSYIK